MWQSVQSLSPGVRMNGCADCWNCASTLLKLSSVHGSVTVVGLRMYGRGSASKSPT